MPLIIATIDAAIVTTGWKLAIETTALLIDNIVAVSALL